MCAQYRLPNGVAFSLLVCTNKVEPPVPNRAFNLLTKHHWRLNCVDEVVPGGP